MKRTILLAAVLSVAAGLWLANANDPPIPEVRILAPVPSPLDATLATPCAADPNNPFERYQYETVEGFSDKDAAGNPIRYKGSCQRLKFAFGPIVVKPGQNDVLVQPITIEKPAYDGYLVRFKPDLVRADGSVPPIEEVHLHHGTWLSILQPYAGTIPFAASGEEKTIGDFPRGYGFPIGGTDTWQMLYMIHNLRPSPDLVWITYDIDYIPTAVAEGDLKLKKAYPVWLDVRQGSGYPVMNVQRNFPSPGSTTCTWPLQNCAAFDPWGALTYHQGGAQTSYGNNDWRIPSTLGKAGAFTGGTLIGIGGHLHPGGLNDTIELVRGDQSKPIFISEAKYWDKSCDGISNWQCNPTGPANSWDMSMTVTGYPRWAIQVRPDDILRINATYENQIQSTYENMGIAIALLAPGDTSGIDPFAAGLAVDSTSTDISSCLPNGVLCLKGSPTHGHLAEANNKGGPDGSALPAKSGSTIQQVTIAAFQYIGSDQGTIGTTGMPTVKLGQTLNFVNLDAAADIYHTVTSCKYPCNGATGIAYPLGNGQSDAGTMVDFDSNELGYGIPSIGPAKNAINWGLEITAANGFKAGETYTYFCRIHPFMRGAFKVTE
jgi:plastocyanin